MFDTICHEHLEYYSSKVIINLIKQNGLRVFDIKNNININSILFVMMTQLSNLISKLKKTLQEESKLKLNKIQSLKFYNI